MHESLLAVQMSRLDRLWTSIDSSSNLAVRGCPRQYTYRSVYCHRKCQGPSKSTTRSSGFEFPCPAALSRSSLRAMRGDLSQPIGVYTMDHDRPAKCTRRAPKCDERPDIRG